MDQRSQTFLYSHKQQGGVGGGGGDHMGTLDIKQQFDSRQPGEFTALCFQISLNMCPTSPSLSHKVKEITQNIKPQLYRMFWCKGTREQIRTQLKMDRKSRRGKKKPTNHLMFDLSRWLENKCL